MGRSNKPPSVQAAVVAKRIGGASKTQIAKDLEMSRSTVIRILNETEIDEFVQRGKTGLYQLIPEAVDSYGKGVRKSAALAGDFLERVKVLPGKEQSAGINVNAFIGIGSLPRSDAVQHRGPVLQQPETN